LALTIALVGIATTATRARSGPTSSFVNCALAGANVTVDLGNTQRTTFFAVLTPDQRSLLLVGPDVNLLGERYKKPKFELSLAREVGDLAGKRERVFMTGGDYRLVFKDANSIAYEEPRHFSCTVRVPEAAL
jgi:hypothetical protein